MEIPPSNSPILPMAVVRALYGRLIANGLRFDPSGEKILKSLPFLLRAVKPSRLHRKRKTLGNLPGRPTGKNWPLPYLKPKNKADKRKEEVWGAFAIDEQEYTNSQLWMMELELPLKDPTNWPCLESDSSDCMEWPKATQLTQGDFHVGGFFMESSRR